MQYEKLVKNLLINQNNLYNFNEINKDCSIKITSAFNTFGNEKNVKLVKLFNILNLVTGQRPYLKIIKFNYIKKKILKRLILSLTLRGYTYNNFISYFSKFYLYFFQIYYQQPIKYSYLNNSVTFYVDNIQFFLKNYIRQNHKTHLKIIIFSKNPKVLVKYLTNQFLIKIKKNEIFDKKK